MGIKKYTYRDEKNDLKKSMKKKPKTNKRTKSSKTPTVLLSAVCHKAVTNIASFLLSLHTISPALNENLN